MRRRGWRQLADDRRLWVGVAALVLVALVLPRACESGKDAVRRYHMAQWHELIDSKAEDAGLDATLVRAVVLAESSGDPRAHSGADAKGLMQITPITHRDALQRFDLPDGDLFDPDYNVTVGTRYLAYLLDRFDGSVTLGLAAYHMGPTRVASLKRKHPQLTPDELVQQHAGPKTRAYVKRVKLEAGMKPPMNAS